MTMYDAIVLGLGGMGSAVTANLAARGLRVLALEQFDRRHDFGASSGRSRLIRKAYFEDPAYVPLLLRAYDLWRALEMQSGQSILHICGLLLAGHAESPVLLGARTSAALHGLALDEFDAREARQKFPAFALRDDEVAAFEPDGGYVVPEAAIAAYLGLAERDGADLRFRARVASWTSSAKRVRVTLDDGTTYDAARLVLCAGPWFSSLGNVLGTNVAVQRNVQYWFRPADDRLRSDRTPAFFLDRSGLPAYLYGFPDDGDGIKAAFHGHGTVTSPEELDREIGTGERDELRTALECWMPGSTASYLAGKVCMYSLTPDKNFVIGALAENERVVVAGGFSGHGFKFASVVGEIVGDVIADGGTRHDIAFLSPQRFR
jgi:sarcosine oxidase